MARKRLVLPDGPSVLNVVSQNLILNAKAGLEARVSLPSLKQRALRIVQEDSLIAVDDSR